MANSTDTAVIIVAAGTGQRAGGTVAKQWQMLAGRSVVDRTLQAFTDHPAITQIVLVLHPDEMSRQFPNVQTVQGGATRAQSVKAGLNAVHQGTLKVLIHDVARPLVTAKIITDVITALQTHKAAAPALPVTDALWRGTDNQVTGTQDRANLYRAQTPQGFDLQTILAAHTANTDDAADDVEVARAAGIDVAIVPGDERNLKLTYSGDFDRAEALLKADMDIRLGNGFDVHKFGPGDHVTLCGVAIPHEKSLLGHSDADVSMHAVTDALYGALAQGDIGRHFPPSAPQWKGVDSAIFLRHAVQLADTMGYKISNIDVTLICERPKITSYADAMTKAMSKIMTLDPSRISIKATTSETLGFTGREEGIAALASATLVTK